MTNARTRTRVRIEVKQVLRMSRIIHVGFPITILILMFSIAKDRYRITLAILI